MSKFENANHVWFRGYEQDYEHPRQWLNDVKQALLSAKVTLADWLQETAKDDKCPICRSPITLAGPDMKIVCSDPFCPSHELQ